MVEFLRTMQEHVHGQIFSDDHFFDIGHIQPFPKPEATSQFQPIALLTEQMTHVSMLEGHFTGFETDNTAYHCGNAIFSEGGGIKSEPFRRYEPNT